MMTVTQTIERKPRELPMLFSAPMVRALLDGTKTVTRRIIKPQGNSMVRELMPNGTSFGWRTDVAHQFGNSTMCTPRHQAGERIWVKETWRTVRKFDSKSPTQIADLARAAGYEPWGPIEYVADGRRMNWQEFMPDEPGKTRVSIHMPRWASRITLEVVDVRAERLQEITDEDAQREGAAVVNGHAELGALIGRGPSYREGFAQLWREINGAGSWESNPWVWRIEFRRVKP